MHILNGIKKSGPEQDPTSNNNTTEQAGRKAIQCTQSQYIIVSLSISVAVKDRTLTPYVIYYFTAVKRRLAFEYPVAFPIRHFMSLLDFFK